MSHDTLARNQNYNRNLVATAQIFDSICVRPLCTYSGLRLFTFKSLTDLLNAFKKLLYLSDAICFMLCKPEKRPEVIVLTFNQSQENTKIWYEYVRFNQHLYRAFPFPRKAWLQVIAVHTTRLVLINTDHSSPRLPYHL